MRKDQKENDEKTVRQLMHYMNVDVMREYFRNGPCRIDHRVVDIAEFWSGITKSPRYVIYDKVLKKSIGDFFELWEKMIDTGACFYFMSNNGFQYVFGTRQPVFNGFGTPNEENAFKYLTSKWGNAFTLFMLLPKI